MSTIDRSHLWPGVPLALGSAVLFGASAPFSKLLLGSIDPWLLAGVLYLGAGIGLAAVHWGRGLVGLGSPEAPLRRSDLPWLAAVVLFGGMLGPVLLMFGLSMTSAASGSLLLNLEGLATMAIAWLVFRENVDRRSTCIIATVTAELRACYQWLIRRDELWRPSVAMPQLQDRLWNCSPCESWVLCY